MRFSACGRMILKIVCAGEMASDSADSHCARGIDSTPPRTISETLPITGIARPITALIQAGNGIECPNRRNWNGNRNIVRNSSTSHGALRVNWVTVEAQRWMTRWWAIWPSPSGTPATVPIAIDRTLTSRLRRNPEKISGSHLTISAGTLAAAGEAVAACASETAASDAAATMAIATKRAVILGSDIGARHVQRPLDPVHDAGVASDQQEVGRQHDQHHLAHIERLRPDRRRGIEQFRHADRVGECRRLDQID